MAVLQPSLELKESAEEDAICQALLATAASLSRHDLAGSDGEGFRVMECHRGGQEDEEEEEEEKEEEGKEGGDGQKPQSEAEMMKSKLREQELLRKAFKSLDMF